jgi:hypothetical protein
MKRGSVPFVTPIKFELGVVILAAANEFAVPEASMLITGANCGDEGFVTANANVKVVPDDRVVYTLKVNVPGVHIPVPCVAPSQNMVSPSSPLSMRVRGLEATAFESPVIVTTEPFVATKSASVTIVTVILFDCPARGLLWPILFVVKDAARTVKHQKLDINSRSIT